MAKAGRIAKKTTVADEPNVDVEKLGSAMALMQSDAASTQLALAQRQSAVRAVAERVGYQLDTTDPDLIQRDIAANMRRSVEACLEVGRGIRVLKEACEHREFVARLESLGVDYSVAQRFMQAAGKFATSRTLTNAAGGQSKLFEMLVLNDEQIEELELTGQTGELDLDDVARMSVKELRAAVRKERNEASKQKNRAERQEAVNAELHEEVRLIKHLPPDEELVRVQKEAVEIQAELQGMLQGRLRQALIALNNSDPDQSLFMGGMVGQLMSDLTMLRDEFSLAEVGGEPEWARWAKAQELAKTGKQAKAN